VAAGAAGPARRSRLAFAAVALSVLAVSALNFNKGELARAFLGVERPPDLLSIDEAQYVGMVERFRGQTPGLELWAPFTYRPLAPWLAARLPFEPLTALNVVNVLSLLGATWFVWRTLRLFEPSAGWQLAGTLAFVWSFPFCYYGTTGLVDPPALLLIAAGLFFVLTDRWWALVAIGFVGGLVKESIVLLWPVALAQCAISRRRDTRTVAAVLLFPVGFALSSALGRALATTRGDYTFWKGLNLLENLSRGRVYVAAALSLGLQGLFALLALPQLRRMATEERRRYLPLVVGALGSLALFGFALVTAHADGRFLWLGHPFLTPLAALGARTLVTELSRRRSLRTAGPSPRY
jgi:hypothetical protein